MNIRFVCPACQCAGRVEVPVVAEWQCPACDHLLRFGPASPGGPVDCCRVCGNVELYKKKDFPHWLGMGLLGSACLAFLVLNGVFHQWWAWAVLLGSALLDGLLYLWVRDVVVCYRCGSHYRGFPASLAHQPYELGTGERYRQERMRLEQMRAEKKPG